MLGQACLVVDPGLGPVDLDGAALLVVVVVVELLVVELFAAEAPEMPAATPPVATAPATIVAPSIRDIRIVFEPFGDVRGPA
jgi:hypothetical protein